MAGNCTFLGTRARAAYGIAVASLLLAGCLPEQLARFGPFPIAVDLGSGALDASALGLPVGTSGTVDITVPICDLITREEVDALAAANLESFLSSLITVDEIAVREFVITAVEGDLSGVQDVILFFLPKSASMLSSEPILVGRATAPEGFDQEIVIVPQSDIDLLEVIEDNENTPGPGCPALILTVTGTFSDEPTMWRGTLIADVYGALGLSL